VSDVTYFIFRHSDSTASKNKATAPCSARWVIETSCPGKWWSHHYEGVQKTHRYGSSGHGVAGMVVLGWRLDLMILEVFSKLNDSMIIHYLDYVPEFLLLFTSSSITYVRGTEIW